MFRSTLVGALLLTACGVDVDLGQLEGEGPAGGGGTGGSGGSPSSGSASSGEPTIKSCTDMLQGAQACLSADAWLASDIYQIAFAPTETDLECRGCHSDGAGLFFASDDSGAMFEYYRYGPVPAMQRLVTCATDENGNAVTLVPSNRIRNKGIEPCPESIVCHPTYSLSPVMEEAVYAFIDDLLSRWQAGGC